MKTNIPLKQRSEAVRTKGFLYDWADSVVFALVIVMAFNLCFRIVNVNGDSMNPTLETNDRLIVSQIGCHPKQGDIIVSVQDNREDQAIIKRVVALAGQTVDIDFESGVVMIDGVAQDDSYTRDPGIIYPLNEIYEPLSFPYTVPEGYVFVMGDNRNNSLDSRSGWIGAIEERYILGEAVFRLFPFDKIGGLQ